MGSNTRCKLALKSLHFGQLVFKCMYPKCCNFFTSNTYMSVKYCKIHKIRSNGKGELADRSRV